MLLTPDVGGNSDDVSADEDGNLALNLLSMDNLSAVVLQVVGLDADITSILLQIEGGGGGVVTPDDQGIFSVDLSGVPAGALDLTVTVTDANFNSAATATTVQVPEQPGAGDTLIIQAEDQTPGDGTFVDIASAADGGQITLYSGTTGLPESGSSGGYADFGSTNNDFITFGFTADQAGAASISLRYANGSGADRPLQMSVNGVVHSNVAFAPTGSFSTWDTLDLTVTLAAGVNQITFAAIANTGPNIDQLSVTFSEDTGDGGTGSGDGGGEISEGLLAVDSLDAAYFSDHLVFNYLENPVQNGFTRDYKEDGTVQLTNDTDSAVSLTGFALDGPFVLQSPGALSGTTLAPGQSIDVTVLFDRSQYDAPNANVDATSTIFSGELEVFSGDTIAATVQLRGFWQAMWENSQEPNLNEIFEAMGFGNRIENLTTIDAGSFDALSNFGVYEKADATEILSPYWQIAEGVETATVTQVAAFHGAASAYFGIHEPGASPVQRRFADDPFFRRQPDAAAGGKQWRGLHHRHHQPRRHPRQLAGRGCLRADHGRGLKRSAAQQHRQHSHRGHAAGALPENFPSL